VSPGVVLGALSLSKLMAELRTLPVDAVVHLGSGRYRPTVLHSYRGYYEDLALDFDMGPPRSATLLIAECCLAIGKWFEGYKGGGYVATVDTAVWAGHWGEANGQAITGLRQVDATTWELVVEEIDP